VHRNQFLKFRDSGRNSKKVLAGTDLLSHIESYVTLSAARQADTSSHQGGLANVRIKRLTNVKRHVHFPCVVQISSYCELLFDTKTYDILSLWNQQSSSSGHDFFISSGWNSEKSEFRQELTGRNRVPVHPQCKIIILKKK
jgi:hypothetical protein